MPIVNIEFTLFHWITQSTYKGRICLNLQSVNTVNDLELMCLCLGTLHCCSMLAFHDNYFNLYILRKDVKLNADAKGLIRQRISTNE